MCKTILVLAFVSQGHVKASVTAQTNFLSKRPSLHYGMAPPQLHLQGQRSTHYGNSNDNWGRSNRPGLHSQAIRDPAVSSPGIPLQSPTESRTLEEASEVAHYWEERAKKWQRLASRFEVNNIVGGVAPYHVSRDWMSEVAFEADITARAARETADETIGHPKLEPLLFYWSQAGLAWSNPVLHAPVLTEEWTSEAATAIATAARLTALAARNTVADKDRAWQAKAAKFMGFKKIETKQGLPIYLYTPQTNAGWDEAAGEWQEASRALVHAQLAFVSSWDEKTSEAQPPQDAFARIFRNITGTSLAMLIGLSTFSGITFAMIHRRRVVSISETPLLAALTVDQ